MHCDSRDMMMVLSLLSLLCIAGFCHGKAFPEEPQKSRGKRVYDHGQDADAEHWKQKGLYYYPQIGGQPIYIPAIHQSENLMNEFLDNYYSSEAWTFATSAPHNYDDSGSLYYENPVTSNSIVKNILDKTNEDGHLENFHVLPAPKQNHLKYKEFNMHHEIKGKEPEHGYYAPEVVDRVKTNVYGNENYNAPKTKSELKYADDEYEEPVVHESFKEDAVNVKNFGDKNFDNPQKTEMDYVDKYEQPVVHETFKQKPDTNIKYEDKQSSIPETNSELEYVDEYEKPIVKQKVKIKPKQDINKVKITSNSNYDIQTSRGTHKKSKGKRRKQSQISKKYETSSEYAVSTVDIKSILDIKTIDGNLDEFHKETDGYELKDPVHTKEKIVKDKPKDYPIEMKEKIVIKDKPKEIKTKEKVVIKDEQKEHPVKIKEKVVIKDEPKEVPVKIKEKVVIKDEPKEPPVKIKEKVVIKDEPKEPPAKIKEKVVIKDKTKEHPAKEKEKVVIKDETKEYPANVKEKVVIKSESKEHPVKTKEKVIKSKPKKPQIKTKDKVVTESDYEHESLQYVMGKNDEFVGDADFPLEDVSTDFSRSLQGLTEGDFLEDELEKQLNTEHVRNPDEAFNIEENKNRFDLENSGSGTVINNKDSMNTPKFLPNIDAVRSLSSLNSNIWSLIFNPNAERLKLKKCITRNNETGYCTYIQHCEVPNIATSLEQLLNNACVIDDIFIGVCCPEFPVETVKVHWEQSPSNSDKRIEEEFDHNGEDCGIRSSEASKLQSWPWKAPLVSMSNGKIFCGGVVISEEYILTAAHCTTKIPRNQILVRLGQYNDSTGDDFAVVEIKRHAQYNPRTMNNDIALLKLGRRIIHDTHIGVICLPEDDDDDKDDHEGKKATLLGWRGIFGTKSKDPEFLEVVSNEECEKKLGMKVPGTLLCTEARNEDERTCNADSGAPLVIKDDDQYEVIGILSWNRNDCDQRFPSTFSRVSSYIGWIQKHAV